VRMTNTIFASNS